jgi:hypothetical protein
MPFDGVETRTTPGSSSPAVSVAPRWLAHHVGKARNATLFRSASERDAIVAVRLLERARRLIERRERWVQGAYRTYYGYCAVGALHAAWRWQNEGAGYALAYNLLRDVAVTHGFSGIVAMNDDSSHEHVLRAFDEATAAARRASADASPHASNAPAFFPTGKIATW